MASMPEFIETGMAFFKGEMVPRPAMTALENANAELTAKMKEIEDSNGKLGVALADVTAKEKTSQEAAEKLKADNESLRSEIANLKASIATLEANFENASKQAQAQVRVAGASQPIESNPGAAAVASGFEGRVAAKVAAGKTKSAAISEAIKESPSDYAEWRKNPTKL